jgi:fermentation-respiration switch protein FrsA (DUF1100 family)
VPACGGSAISGCRLAASPADDYCTPANATNVYDRAGDPKEIVWLNTTNHIDLCNRAQFADRAVDATVEWLRRWLG